MSLLHDMTASTRDKTRGLETDTFYAAWRRMHEPLRLDVLRAALMNTVAIEFSVMLTAQMRYRYDTKTTQTSRLVSAVRTAG